MGMYSLPAIINVLKEKGVTLFSLADFGRLFSIKNQNTLYKKIQRLEEKKIVKRFIKGKYCFLLNSPDDFTLANFLRPPSYVSLESALSFYGIISGFPYKITSLTIRKSRSFNIDNKIFQYSHISHNLFWGYEKKESFLMAEKEKALLDGLYFQTKGLLHIDEDEIDVSGIDKQKIIAYARKFKNQKLWAILKKIL